MQVRPVGIVHTPFREPRATPVQPRLADGAMGTVEVFEEYREAVRDLDGFERIWLVCWFHRVSPPRLRLTPHWDDVERGLFATREPSRPNPIGISPVRLVRIDGTKLTVADVDILDGTPLLDIKPYLPYFDCFPASKSGWVSQAGRWRGLTEEPPGGRAAGR